MKTRFAVVALLATQACAPRHPGAPELRADSTRTERLAAGVTYDYRWYRTGPWAIHTVTVDPKACGIELRSFKAGDHVFGRENTTAMAQRAAAQYGRPVLVAVNADFFSYQPPGVTEGPEVAYGRILKSEGSRREAVTDKRVRMQPVFAFTADHLPLLAYTHWRGTIQIDTAHATLAGLNVAIRSDSAFMFDSFWGKTTPSDSNAVELVTRNGVIAAVDSAVDGVAIPENGFVITLHGAARTAVHPHVGDSVRVAMSFDDLPSNVSELMGGYPMLLHDGQPRFADESVIASFGQQRHPRTLIGWGKDRRINIIVVDGRKPGYSAGMSLKELTDYLLSRGITEALNFDGGGSSTMALNGKLANLPSDSASERLVAESLLVLGPAAGRCR